MKKLTLIALALCVVLTLFACGKKSEEPAGTTTEAPAGTTEAPIPTTTVKPDDGKVTIYIPDTDTAFRADTISANLTVTYIFEEGWQEKESFRVTFSGILGVGSDVPTMIVNGKTIITEIAGVYRSEATYNDNGRLISRITPFLTEDANMAKMEFTFTYDAQGRKLTQVTKYRYPDKAEPVIETQSYTYVDTEAGSKGTFTEGNTTYVLEYDKNYRLVAEVTITDGQEVSREENEYDECGNLLSQTTYVNGQKQMEMKYTWKAVEVSRETASRLPQFNKGN